MKYNNTLEYQDAIAKLIKRNLDIVALAKKEERELTDDENAEFDKNAEEEKELEKEKDELERELEKEQPEEEKGCDNENKDDEENRSKQNISIDNKMENKYSLMKELRNALETGKSVKIENRAYTVASEGEDLVQTDIYNILEPLRAQLVLTQAGAHMMTGLVGDVQVPIMGAGNVAWAAETGAASDGSGSFSHVTLSPKRLTGKFPISLQFLAQDSVDAEAAIRRDIINAIAEKLEATILSDDAATDTVPAGIFALGADESLVEVDDYAALCDAEAILDAANVYGEKKYIVAPNVKAAFRSMLKGTNATGMVMENGEIDGTQAFVSSLVDADNFVYGDFANLYIGQWGDIQLDVVRDTASLVNGCVTIVVNCFFDAVVARPEAFVKCTIDAD